MKNLRENLTAKAVRLVFALPIFPGRPTYCPAAATVRWTVAGRSPQSSHTIILKASCVSRRLVFSLPILPGRPTYCPAAATVRWTVAGRSPQSSHTIILKASCVSRRLVFALPIFPGSHPPSIVGVHVLNFCVRDGNRWTHMTINTNS